MPKTIKLPYEITYRLNDFNPTLHLSLMHLMEEAYKAGYTDGKIDMLEAIGKMTTKVKKNEG